jgi:hypothetical protein
LGLFLLCAFRINIGLLGNILNTISSNISSLPIRTRSLPRVLRRHASGIMIAFRIPTTLHSNISAGVVVMIHQELQSLEFAFQIPLQSVNIFS